MNNIIRFTAIDPALRNWGLVSFAYDKLTNDLTLIDMKLIETEQDAAKTVRKNSSDLRCAAELYEASMQFMQGSKLFAAEIPSGTQSARGAMSNGVCLGVLAGLSGTHPLIQVSIAEAKKIATGRKTGSKEEMIHYAHSRFPDAPWIKRKFKGQLVLVDKNEHLADAISIGIAATQTPEFKAAVRMSS